MILTFFFSFSAYFQYSLYIICFLIEFIFLPFTCMSLSVLIFSFFFSHVIWTRSKWVQKIYLPKWQRNTVFYQSDFALFTTKTFLKFLSFMQLKKLIFLIIKQLYLLLHYAANLAYVKIQIWKLPLCDG